MKIQPIFSRVFQPTFINDKKKIERHTPEPKPEDLSPDVFQRQELRYPELAFAKY